MTKLIFQQLLLQCLVLHDLSDIILYADLVLNVDNSAA